tara:strand:+ start:651 stop:1061 length:411 start_codon:yes stop_codon:yes gene_type:complete
MERICSQDLVKKIRWHDPVRPLIPAEERNGPAREMYHLDNKAYICLAYVNKIPSDETTLLSSPCGPIVVAYTVWSTEKGKGREIILGTRDMIKKAKRFTRLVTLSPKTTMALKFHLSNGAKKLRENESSYNFEYEL